MNDDVPWCIIFQSPHSSEYCDVAQSFVPDHNAQSEEEEAEKNHDDISCNMVNICSNSMDSDLEEIENDLEDKRISYQLHHQQVFSDDEEHDEDQVCVASSKIGHVNLRMPSKE